MSDRRGYTDMSKPVGGFRKPRLEHLIDAELPPLRIKRRPCYGVAGQAPREPVAASKEKGEGG